MSDNHPHLMNIGAGVSSQGSNAGLLLAASMCSSTSGIITSLHRSSSSAGSNGEINHVSYLSDHIGSLYMCDDYSDIRLIVEGNAFPTHRVILASRSEYFRAMLFGGMRETNEKEVELLETNIDSFRVLLKYIYTGKLSLSNLSEELVLDVLGLAHKYGFTELEQAVSEYLKAILNSFNLCTIFGASHLYSLRSLADYCLDYADKHANDILSTPGFLTLSAGAVEQLMSRDSFCAKEIDIFHAINNWVRHHPDCDGCDRIVAQLRLPLIKDKDLLNIVRPSGLLPADAILDALKEQMEKRKMDLMYRGFMLPGVNVATAQYNSTVIEGELKNALLNGDNINYDMERGFTRHPIEDKNAGIVVQLGMQCIINHIRLLLWDKDARSYSYYVEVSLDQEDWVRVVDHSTYLCRSTQRLYFRPRVVQYIRIVGTHNSVNRVFHLVSLEAYYVSIPIEIDDTTGLLVPSTNVATIENSASVIEGVSRSRNALLNGETTNYNWDSGYTCHQLGSGAIVVQLPQPYMIDSMRLLLWDCDQREYGYYIEVSNDQQVWKRVADKTQELCRAWQLLRFPRQPITFIRIVGTYNSANEVFHCVHFECPAQRDSMTALTAATANNDNIVSGSAQTASSQTSPMVDNDNVAVK